MNFSLTKLPWWAQICAFIVLAGGLVSVYYFYYEAPVREDFSQRQHQLTLLRADITKGMTTAAKLPEFRAQVTDLESRLQNLKAVLPDEKDAEDLLRRMQTVAVQSNLTIKSFKPAPTVTKTLHAEWPIQLELEGTYHNFAIFCDRVGKFTRIINITGLDLKGRDKPSANLTMNASCIATTFVLLDKPQPAKTSKSPAAAKSS